MDEDVLTVYFVLQGSYPARLKEILIVTALMWFKDVLTVYFVLQGSYPARLKKVLIVTAPMWFKAPFKILRLFVKEKLRDRVRIH